MDYGIEEESKRKIIAVLSALFPQAKIYLFLTTKIFCISTIQCAEQCIIKSVNEQVNDLVFADCSAFSHEDLMNFGLVCHNNHKYLCTTAQQRKNYCLMCMPMTQERCNSFQWHKYGSRADRKQIINSYTLSSITGKRLCLERLELADNAKIYKYYGRWDNFEAELLGKTAPFLDKSKQLCFFGHGWLDVPGFGQCGNVILYKMQRILQNGSKIETKSGQKAIRCLLDCDEDEVSYNKEPLCILLEFPYLLTSILASNSVKKISVPQYQKSNCYLLYSLKNCVIPDNYKEFVQHCAKQISYKTFDDLPGNLKKAITQQYEKQKNIRPD